jgi:hypothetical protein
MVYSTIEADNFSLSSKVGERTQQCNAKSARCLPLESNWLQAATVINNRAFVMHILDDHNRVSPIENDSLFLSHLKEVYVHRLGSHSRSS